MMSLFLILFMVSSGSKDLPPTGFPTYYKGEYKSLTTARMLSAVVPGAGQFYVHNYLKGSTTFLITTGMTAFSLWAFNETKYAKSEVENGLSREDYQLIGILTGCAALFSWAYQIWDINDDVVVYNYRVRFLKSFSFKLNNQGLSIITTFG